MQATNHKTSISEQLLARASHIMPGGVNSPVRAFTAVGGKPRFISHARGAYLFDVDGQRYIDYVGSWGPMILGHAHPAIVQAVNSVSQSGFSFGAPCELEIGLAETICRLMPSLEKIRMVNSGTEATMSALRVARAATGRDKFIKFDGCYHGHADSFLVKAGSGALTLGTPSSPGVPRATAANTLTAVFNNLDSVDQLFARHPHDIAAIIIEPIAGNMGMIKAKPEFLAGLRQLCDQYDTLLIFDEVMSGFRVALGGAQAIYPTKPDLTTLGKVIGGGLPIGAYGGRHDLMDLVAPKGPVYQAGTLAGNPIAMAAGLATLKCLDDEIFSNLHRHSAKLIEGIIAAANRQGIPCQGNYQGGMFGLFFSKESEISSVEDASNCDHRLFKDFFQTMLGMGCYFAPSGFEAGFMSVAHRASDIEQTILAAEQTFDIIH